MRLVRIRDWRKAGLVAAGVRRYNGVSVSRQRILSRPHFTIETGSRVAGWIGFEGRRPGVFELVHLSVKPQYRHGGLAQSAVYRVLNMVRSCGGRYAYTRINHRNYPSMCLARKLGFARTSRGPLVRYGRRV
ncbi:MAG: GNAT family N-acetyltransferase [Selenomonadales bacterium]|nr:GNAT family N-acetyltransferase [Selenomonadales bacterium]